MNIALRVSRGTCLFFSIMRVHQGLGFFASSLHFDLTLTSASHPRSTPPSHAQGMNYLAGFVLVILADCVLSEREGTPAASSRDPGSAGSNSTTTSGSSSSSSPQTGAVAASAAGKEKDGDASGGGPTEAEVSVIEGECVQVMQGIIALQGGVLSRDLWGLHAVSVTRAEAGRGIVHLPDGCTAVRWFTIRPNLSG